ncbi:MAG TPA: OmpA family protein [Acidobacteriota bacterium]|nr:OmpA family protein [Acidobacteriota bacterium]
MTRLQKILMSTVVGILMFVSASIVYAQNESTPAGSNRTDLIQVQAGQRMDLEGVVVNQGTDNLVMRGTGGGLYKVLVAGAEIKEKKSNPFRGAKKYTKADLLQGLYIEVKGSGDSSGAIAAREIRFRSDDSVMARTMDARVMPVENSLKDTQARLGETEQNEKRLSGQVRELSAVTDVVRDSAKAAQTSADGAMSEAKNARSTADTAKAGVKAANERITSLDDYDVKTVSVVNFKAGSAVLSDKDRAGLDTFAQNTKNEKGYLIEVTGYASSDGDEAFNRRLSQKRADAVIQYLAENYSIPLRRFIVPMGYGVKNPVADNATVAGRKENRRVEIRILVSKGMTYGDNSPSAAETKISSN